MGLTASSPGGDTRPVGVFDSGVGGLTVARALMDLMPDERIVYLGDTARGPYGPRDLSEVRGFACQIVEHLAAHDAKLVVVACNTATAALDTAPELADGLPVQVQGVIQPAVDAAIRGTRNQRIGVIGTVGTIASGAYARAVAERAPGVDLVAQACPRFVELVEAGRTTDPEVLRVARDYLQPLVEAQVDTVILGCTHYPLLTGVLSYVLGPGVVLVSSAEETARRVFASLVEGGMVAPHRHAEHRFVATGDAASFTAMAARFLGPRVADRAVEHVRLGSSDGDRGQRGEGTSSAGPPDRVADRAASTNPVGGRR